jgi:hypothetical protein
LFLLPLPPTAGLFQYDQRAAQKLQNTGQGEIWEAAATRKLGKFFSFFPLYILILTNVL